MSISLGKAALMARCAVPGSFPSGAAFLFASFTFQLMSASGWEYFTSGLSYPSYLAVNKAGNLFVADYRDGVIYEYKPSGSRAIFASGLYHPVGMAFDSAGNLFVADNSIDDIYQGSIYKYSPNGSRVIFAVLDPGHRPADLAFDTMGNLYLADLGGRSINMI